MPCEIIKVAFKPVNFFERNPALDVPPSTWVSSLLLDYTNEILMLETHIGKLLIKASS